MLAILLTPKIIKVIGEWVLLLIKTSQMECLKSVLMVGSQSMINFISLIPLNFLISEVL